MYCASESPDIQYMHRHTTNIVQRISCFLLNKWKCGQTLTLLTLEKLVIMITLINNITFEWKTLRLVIAEGRGDEVPFINSWRKSRWSMVNENYDDNRLKFNQLLSIYENETNMQWFFSEFLIVNYIKSNWYDQSVVRLRYSKMISIGLLSINEVKNNWHSSNRSRMRRVEMNLLLYKTQVLII